MPYAGQITAEQLRRLRELLQEQQDYQNYWVRQLNNYGNRNAAIPDYAVAPRVPKTVIEETPEEETGMALANDFLVGCDPEFVVLDEGRLVNVAGAIGPVGKVGHDHGGDVVEVRPEPAKGTFTLLKRIQQLLLGDAKERLPKAKWRAGALVRFNEQLEPVMARNEWDDPIPQPPGVRWFGEDLAQVPAPAYQAAPPRRGHRRERITLGGHVHLGLSPYLKDKLEMKIPEGYVRMPAEFHRHWGANQFVMREGAEETVRAYVNGGDVRIGNLVVYVGSPQPVLDPTHEDRIKALDHLTRRLEALDILPQRECEGRRGAGEYGRFGDVRIDKLASGDYKTEYRTMASWLYDPKVAMLCLTAAKLAACDPKGAVEALGRFHDFAPLKKWFEGFATKDLNAKQVVEKILSKGLKAIQADPEVDFKERWEGALI